MEGSMSLPARRIVLTKQSGFGERPFVGTAQRGESTSISPTTMNNSNTNKSFGGERTKVMGDPNDVHFPYIRDNIRNLEHVAWPRPPQDPAEGAQSIARTPTVRWFLDSVFLDPVYECLATEIEITGCAGLVPIASVKGPQNELLLDRFQTDALGR
jgi:hypothetical protein